MDLLQIALVTGLANTIAEDEKKKRERNIIEIPDNATNGDIIKAVFPNAQFSDGAIRERIFDKSNFMIGEVYMDWWNASYKIESEE